MFYIVRNRKGKRSTASTPIERIWLRVLGTLNEYQARLYVAEKALDLGRGGVTHLSRLTGMSRVTITQGLSDLRGRADLRVAAGRVRNPGGGRKKVEETDPAMSRRLKAIVEETTAGDPMSPLKWTAKSTRTIAEELTRLGHPISSVTVGRCLDEMGYTLQANVKSREGSQNPDRDAQFRYLNGQVKGFRRAGDPVISVDTNSSGPLKMGGGDGYPRGRPTRFRSTTSHTWGKERLFRTALTTSRGIGLLSMLG